MAPVEMDIYYGGETDHVVTTVHPGSFEGNQDLTPATLFVFCDPCDTKGTLAVNGDSDHIEVVKHMDEEDQNGQVIDFNNRPVEFSGEQWIEIISDCHRETIYLSHLIPSEAQETTSEQVSLPERKLVPIK